jgi:hypothetical protein
MTKSIKRALLFDINFSAYPLYKALRELNFEVHVVGNDESAPLAKLCRHYHNVDYSNRESINRLIQLVKPHYLIPGCTDVSYLSCLEFAQQLYFPGFDDIDTGIKLHGKHTAREMVQICGGLIPDQLDLVEHDDSGMMIIKPTDSFSGRGISIVSANDNVAIEEAKQKALSMSKTNQIIVERFVKGDLLSHSASIFKGRIITDVFVNEYCTQDPFSVDTSYVSVNVNSNIKKDLRRLVESMADRFHLVDGLVHTQFIFDGTECQILEMTRRCPGDLYAQLVTLSTGIDYAKTYISAFADSNYGTETYASDKTRYIVRHTVKSDSLGLLESIAFNSDLRIVSWIPLMKNNYYVKNKFERVGILFAEASSEGSLRELSSLCCAGEAVKLSWVQ